MLPLQRGTMARTGFNAQPSRGRTALRVCQLLLLLPHNVKIRYLRQLECGS
jgi:hypothetical protein